MKNIFIIILFLWVCAMYSFPGKAIAAVPEALIPVEKALKANDARMLGVYMDNVVTISILNKVNIYSKGQAQNIIRAFLDRDKRAVFTLEKWGKSVDGSGLYGIGRYKTRRKQYIVYFFMKYDKGTDEYLLKEIKID